MKPSQRKLAPPPNLPPIRQQTNPRKRKARSNPNPPETQPKRTTRAEKEPTLVETVNSLPLSTLIDNYMPLKYRELPHPYDQTHRVDIQSSRTISKDGFTACFRLIEMTSAEAYKLSSPEGWSPAKKKREMRLPDLRYLILKRKRGLGSDEKEIVEGFASFMITYEDRHEVVYCYEIHLLPYLQDKGLGRYLIEIVEAFGRNIGPFGVEKAMLTVFVSNTSAIKFYEKLGYKEDSYSPGPRKLRNGTVKRPGYVILSKSLRQFKIIPVTVEQLSRGATLITEEELSQLRASEPERFGEME